MLKQGFNVIIDGQWGSTGKGKLAGYITKREQPDAVICDFMPNAGHTFVENDGTKHVFKQLPVAAARCFGGTPIFVGPHSAISLPILLEEIQGNRCADRLSIHPLAAIITEADLTVEANTTGYIAATCKGGHSANSRKALRHKSAKTAQDIPELRPYVKHNFHDQLQKMVRSGAKVLAETAQGFDLSLNHGWTYPYVTGRDCLVGRVFDNAGIPVRRLGSIVMSLRTYPIRVGNTDSGMSGPYYPDQTELSWDEISQREGLKISPEVTTVTGRIRRVFEFSHTQLTRALRHLEPDFAFLNFVNYYRGGWEDERVHNLHDRCRQSGCQLKLAGVGAKDGEMIVL